MYRRSQTGGVVIISLAVGILITIVLGFSIGWNPAMTFAIITLIACVAMFYSLTIEIDSVQLRCFFGPGLIRRRLLLSDISNAIPVRNHWYYGWGIRLIPSGWMFNVSGLDAVELQLRNGKRFRIGTDKPNEVVEEIKNRKQ